jgi:RND family efflux transporter MFP subunit
VTTLVTITQLDPIAVAFNLPQRNLPDALARLASGGVDVTAQLPSVPGPEGRLHGKLQFVDNNIDATSGTVRVKALFDNPKRLLWPGAFINVSLTLRTLKDVVVVPQAAIINSARGTIVYTVQDGKALLRPVQVLYARGDDAAVGGVQPGDAVVVDGRQNLRPGVAVAEHDGAASSPP